MVTRRCPCGYETRATFRGAESTPEEPSITAELYGTASEGETAKWRSQLEKKFEPAREKLPDLEEAQQLVDDMFRPGLSGLRKEEAIEADSGPIEHEETAAADMLDDLLDDDDQADEPDLSIPRRPAQQALTLEPFIPKMTKARVRPEEDAARAISKEILFSRLLAGILDLLLPVATAVLFVFTACWLLNLDFFSRSATISWLLLALGFYFFNSLYFFWTAGRTPGMFVTDLQLAGEDSQEPSFGSVIIRTLLFLPVVATVFGLLFALLDSECRAVHDRLSKTRVIPG